MEPIFFIVEDKQTFLLEEGRMKPFGLIADLHFHNWTQFQVTREDGVNGRLHGLLKEVLRCADEVKKAGGETMFVAGDVFHVRGSVAPSVQNPVMDTFKAIIAAGMNVVIMPGNHDLEGKHTTRLGSAVTALAEVGATVLSEPTGYGQVACVPWFDSVKQLKEELEVIAKGYTSSARSNTDLLLHAPVNGVIAGLPDHGVDPAWLASLGFRRVFSGHYHNHKDFGNSVYSIGALAHHTFSDIGSRAGFLIVGDDVRWMKSHLPEFQDLDNLVALDPDSLPLLVDGNYVRVRTELSKVSEIEEIKAQLLGYGAKAVIVNSVRKPEARRVGGVVTSIGAGASLAVSVAEYVKGNSFSHQELTNKACQEVLAEAGV